MLPRVLKTFTSTVSLVIETTGLSLDDGLAVHVSLGDFGKGITRLALVFMAQSFTVITSLVFSLQNLRELIIDNVDFRPDVSPPVVPDISPRVPLELFVARGPQQGNYFAISKWKLASRRLSLNSIFEGMELLIGISSETMVALALMGMQLLRTFGKRI